jgi:hypothetical protein
VIRLSEPIEHWMIGSDLSCRGGIFISRPRWGLGFALHEWGIRLLLTKWQVCLRWRDR